ncbi:MAG: hypothetical protein LBQ09_07825 [Acidobacteriaceae bacterium]|jgi:hypothetical protein|nr:hypothetical protein [Acidobacteriaceae bacterium]
MSTATVHFENANFLRELAERLPSIYRASTPDRVELLQRLADEELAEAEYTEMIRAKVAAARADTRPGMSNDDARAFIHARFERLNNGA